MTSPSIQTAFADKKRLFLEAAEGYLCGTVMLDPAIEEAASASGIA